MHNCHSLHVIAILLRAGPTHASPTIWMNRFAKATLPVGPAGRDGKGEGRHFHRAAACLQTKARPPPWIHTPQTQAGPQLHTGASGGDPASGASGGDPASVTQVSATLRAKGISKEMIVPKPAGVLASKGIGMQTFQLLHARTSQEPSSSTSLRSFTPTTVSNSRSLPSSLVPYHVSHQQQIRNEAMKKHPR